MIPVRVYEHCDMLCIILGHAHVWWSTGYVIVNLKGHSLKSSSRECLGNSCHCLESHLKAGQVYPIRNVHSRQLLREKHFHAIGRNEPDLVQLKSHVVCYTLLLTLLIQNIVVELERLTVFEPVKARVLSRASPPDQLRHRRSETFLRRGSYNHPLQDNDNKLTLSSAPF